MVRRHTAEAAWVTNDEWARVCIFESDDFVLRGRPDLTEYVKPYAGFTIRVVQPGNPGGLYHAESAQEHFLILMGECILVIEDQERHLRTWDFVHCPPMTAHTFVATGTGPCVILATGNRRDDLERVYPRSEVALRYGASQRRTRSGAGDGRSSAQSTGTNSHGLNGPSPLGCALQLGPNAAAHQNQRGERLLDRQATGSYQDVVCAMTRSAHWVACACTVLRMGGRVALVLAAIAGAVVLGGAPSSRAAPSSEIVGITALGSGANEAWVIAPGGARSIVIFLHERGDPIPQNYLGWLDHLAAEESAVVFPRYENAASRTPRQMLRALRAAVTTAEGHLARLPVSGFGGGPIKGVPVIVVGYSYGATLALYVAANSARWGLPEPRAVVSIFPRPGRFPGIALPPLARSTRLVLQVGDADTTSAKTAAKDLWRAIEGHPAARKRLTTVHSGGGLRADHGAPLRMTSAAVDAFWQPLDQIIYDVRGG
jgi:uncharacterized cupin superfamily protein